MLKDTSQRTALGVVAAILLLVIATSPLWTALLIKWHASRIVDDTLLGVTTSALANVNVTEGFLETALAINATNQSERQKYLDQIDERTRSTDWNLQQYKPGIRDDTDRKNYEHLLASRTQFRQTRQQVFALLAQDKRAEAERIFNAEGLGEYQVYLEALNSLVRYNMDEAAVRGTQIQRLANILIGVQIVFLIFFIVYAFFVPLITLLERLTRKQIVDDI